MINKKSIQNSDEKTIYYATILVLILSCFVCPFQSKASYEPQHSMETSEDAAFDISTVIKHQLHQSFPDARIVLQGPPQWSKMAGREFGINDVMTLLSTDSRGIARFSTSSSGGAHQGECWVRFEAWLPVKIALKRVRPGELLMPEMFSNRSMDLATGQAYEYRGVVVSGQTDVKGLEAIQTIVEGQLLLGSAVQRVPDIRRGDSVRVQLITKGLVLSAPGIAQEPSYTHHQVRVLTLKTKKELLGHLLPGGIVEVKL